MKHLLAVLVLAIAGSAFASGFVLTGGVKLAPLSPYLAASVTVERPSFNLFGVRWGPLAIFKFDTDFASLNVDLKTGLGGAIILPNTDWAVKAKVLLDTQLSIGSGFEVGPVFQVDFEKHF